MHKGRILISSFVGAVFLTGAILLSTNVKADDVVDQINITVPTACTMSGNGMASHNAEIQNGTYEDDIGTTTLHAFCNDSAGFAVYAVGYTDDEFGKNVLTNAGLGSTYDIATGTATSGNTSNWAMKLAIAQDSGDTTGANAFSLDNSFGSYHNVPATYTKVAHKNSATDMTTNTGGVKLTTTYAAFINKTQPAGTYTGQVKYTLVHPANETPLQPQTATSGCINYFPNGSNVVGTMGCQTLSVSDTEAGLLASNFSRDGYGFAGWNDRYDYSGNFFGPNEDITFTAGQYSGSNNGLALYAVWVRSVGSLQDSAKVAEICGTGTGSLTTTPTDGTASLRSISALTDQRDGQTYAIAKLADGKCWMIENLRLENTNSDNSTGALAQGYGTSSVYGNFSGLADAESSGFVPTYMANSLYYSGTQEGTASIDIGTTNNPGYRMPRYNNYNTQSRASNPSNDRNNMYSYGNYYTWHAAVADLAFASNRSVTNTSLCPAGWHVPTGGLAYPSGSSSGINVTGDTSTFSEFYFLSYKIMDEVRTAYEDTPNSGYAAYSSNTTNNAGKTAGKAFRSFPNNFLYSGYFYKNYISRSYSVYWSSTSGSGASAWILSVYSSKLEPGTSSNTKNYGLPLRCLASI